MVTVRSAKSKGSCFEYDCQESLKQIFPDVYLTKQRGFQLMYDIQTDANRCVFECKRLKGISWNTLVKLYGKLISVRTSGYQGFILFKSNHQPCLVFNGTSILTFEKRFAVPFIKHEPVKRGIKHD
jgi:hypothetical protein